MEQPPVPTQLIQGMELLPEQERRSFKTKAAPGFRKTWGLSSHLISSSLQTDFLDSSTITWVWSFRHWIDVIVRTHSSFTVFLIVPFLYHALIQ